jgi:hypothetical protein
MNLKRARCRALEKQAITAAAYSESAAPIAAAYAAWSGTMNFT